MNFDLGWLNRKDIKDKIIMLFIDYRLITAAAVIIQLILVKSISNNNINKVEQDI